MSSKLYSMINFNNKFYFSHLLLLNLQSPETMVTNFGGWHDVSSDEFA